MFKTNQGASNLAECGPREKKKKGASELRGSFSERKSPLPPGRAWRQGLPVATGRSRQDYELGRPGQAELLRPRAEANCPRKHLYSKASWNGEYV